AARLLAEETFDTVALVRACQELGQLDGAVELIRRTAFEALETGRSAGALVTLELLPAGVRRSYPDLSLAEARSLQNVGRLREASDAAEAALQHGGRTGDVYIQIWSLVELATVTFLAGEVSDAE